MEASWEFVSALLSVMACRGLVWQAFQDDEEDPFRPKDKAADGKKGDEGVTKLYGAWQTVEWVAPRAENGRVPKNERGNVMVPPLAFSVPTVRGCHAFNLHGQNWCC